MWREKNLTRLFFMDTKFIKIKAKNRFKKN